MFFKSFSNFYNLFNKNRLCSKTCGVDIDIEDKKDQAKIEGFFS